MSNLDAVLLEAREPLEALPEHLLFEMEGLLQLRFVLPAPAAQADEAVGAAPGAPLRFTRRPTAAVPAGLAPHPAEPHCTCNDLISAPPIASSVVHFNP